MASRVRAKLNAGRRHRSCSVQLRAFMETLLTYFHAKGGSPMTLRWNTSIAALAFLALAATLISANAPWAAEPEVQKLAEGPGDSPSPGDADTTPGEDTDAAPAASPGDDQVSGRGRARKRCRRAACGRGRRAERASDLTPSPRRKPRNLRASPRSRLPRTKTSMGLRGKRRSRRPQPRTMTKTRKPRRRPNRKKPIPKAPTPPRRQSPVTSPSQQIPLPLQLSRRWRSTAPAAIRWGELPGTESQRRISETSCCLTRSCRSLVSSCRATRMGRSSSPRLPSRRCLTTASRNSTASGSRPRKRSRRSTTGSRASARRWLPPAAIASRSTRRLSLRRLPQTSTPSRSICARACATSR